MRSWLIAYALASLPSVAHAQHARDAEAAVREWPVDPRCGDGVVVTQRGQVFRGTIVRDVPHEDVELEVDVGVVRRIAWEAVRYVGPVAYAPEAARDARCAPLVRVRFETDARLVLHRTEADRPDGRLQRACEGACEQRWTPGRYGLALSIADEVPAFSGVLDIGRSGTLRGTHVDNGVLRAVGWVTFAVGITMAAIMLPMVAFDQIGNSGRLPSIVTGVTFGVAGLAVGLPLAAARSGMIVTFE